MQNKAIHNFHLLKNLYFFQKIEPHNKILIKNSEASEKMRLIEKGHNIISSQIKKEKEEQGYRKLCRDDTVSRNI